MNLRFTTRATEDLRDIADYLQERNPAAALRVRAAILESLRHLTSFPRAGRRQAVEGVRKLVTRRYSYLVYYSVDEIAGEIAVLTIRHPAREREYSDT